MNTYQLFFGRNIGVDGYVNDDNLTAFIDGVLAMAFDSFTLQHAEGCWQGIREDTLIVTVATSVYDKIVDVANCYKNAFSQDAVGVMPIPSMQFV